MKTALLALSFLLFALTTKLLLAAADAEPNPVRDISGEELRAGTSYYILSAFWGAGGGGVTLAKTGNKTCPVDVAQEPWDFLYGIPSTFSPVNPEEGVVRVSTDQNIKFSITENCNQSTVWKLDDYDELTGKHFLTTGGVEGNPGPQTLNNWFKIKETGFYFYKLVYCPSVCSSCKTLCSDIGFYVENGVRRLALSDTPFFIVFRKPATPSVGGSII